MASPLDLSLKNGIEYLTVEDRWNVLSVLILHSNVRNRCWVGMDRIAKLATNGNLTKANAAKKWLLEHGAIQLVPFNKRMDAEKKLPPRQHVYQLTGVFEVDERKYHYFHMNEDTELNVLNGENINVPTIENINGENISSSIISSKDSSAPKKSADKTPRKANPNEPLFNALVVTFGFAPSEMKGKGGKPYWVAAADLKTQGVDTEDIPGLYHYVKNRAETENWRGWTVMALPKYVPDWRKAGKPDGTENDPYEEMFRGLKLVVAGES